MIIKREIHITLTISDIEAIIAEYLANKENINVEDIQFNVGEKPTAGPYEDRFPTYILKDITVKGS